MIPILRFAVLLVLFLSRAPRSAAKSTLGPCHYIRNVGGKHGNLFLRSLVGWVKRYADTNPVDQHDEPVGDRDRSSATKLDIF